MSGAGPALTASSSTTTRPAVSRSIRMCGLGMPPTIIDLSRNHRRLWPSPSRRTVPQPMPPTVCPKLRQMREMIAAEERRRFRTIRAQRQEAAIQKWRAAPAETGNRAFFQLGVDLRSAGLSMADIEATLRQEAGYARHPAERRDQIRASCGRYGDRLADWLHDHRRSIAGRPCTC